MLPIKFTEQSVSRSRYPWNSAQYDVEAIMEILQARQDKSPSNAFYVVVSCEYRDYSVGSESSLHISESLRIAVASTCRVQDKKDTRTNRGIPIWYKYPSS